MWRPLLPDARILRAIPVATGLVVGEECWRYGVSAPAVAILTGAKHRWKGLNCRLRGMRWNAMTSSLAADLNGISQGGWRG